MNKENTSEILSLSIRTQWNKNNNRYSWFMNEGKLIRYIYCSDLSCIEAKKKVISSVLTFNGVCPEVTVSNEKVDGFYIVTISLAGSSQHPLAGRIDKAIESFPCLISNNRRGSRHMHIKPLYNSLESKMKKSGWIQKLNRDGIFQLRWFVLEGNILSYYKSPEDIEPRAAINLIGSLTSTSDTYKCQSTMVPLPIPYFRNSITEYKGYFIHITAIPSYTLSKTKKLSSFKSLMSEIFPPSIDKESFYQSIVLRVNSKSLCDDWVRAINDASIQQQESFISKNKDSITKRTLSPLA